MAADSQNSPIPDGENETLALYLKRKERELKDQIAALHSALAPKERELKEVHKAMQALGLYAGPLQAFVDVAQSQLGSQQSSLEDLANEVAALARTNSTHDEIVSPLSLVTTVAAQALQNLTIKQMILNALRDHFHDGASPTELRDYMRTVYSREVNRDSISPQLARLREQGAVDMLNDGKWKISKLGMLYNHPSSFKD
jgi:phage-related tail protein